MSEQYPLLSPELAEQDPPSPRCRRLLASKERARHHVKGAAAILVRWPRHWSTLLTYWWLGISMLAIVTYIIYNSIFVYSAHSYKVHRTPMAIVQPANLSSPSKLTVPPKVVMHIFLDDKQVIDMDQYLPYIDIVTSKYRHLKFELIFVHNDIFIEIKQFNDKERNELALNNLWYDNSISQFAEHNNNLKIKHMTLSMYFYDSPLKKHWKKLNFQFQKFFVRALSVWQKGGISFDPIVLTPQSPNSIYIEKIYSILQRYDPKKLKVLKGHKIIKKPFKSVNPKHRPNNIRDIINTLEEKEENIAVNNISEHLMAEETRNIETNLTEIYHERKSRSPDSENGSESEKIYPNTITPTTVQNQEKHADKRKYTLLPMFLQYLFNNKPIEPDSINKIEIAQRNSTELTQASNESEVVSTKDFWKQIAEQNVEKPVVLSAKRIIEKPNNDLNNHVTDKVIEDFDVTIDLKGNIIATDTVCHAFIGTLFNNIIHYNDTETVTDFIIKELSSFCKGLLASCVGIDVILL